MPTSDIPFRLGGPLRSAPVIGPLVLGLAERALAFERLANIHRQAAGHSSDPAEFASHALGLLQVEFAIDESQLERIPANGPAIVVANHPYGGIEGLLLIAMLRRRRPDARLFANQLLNRIPELRDAIIPVDAFGGSQAAHANRKAVLTALRHVQSDGLLALFPAGTVSHLHLSAGRVCDPRWSESAARLIRMCACPVIPVHFGGANGIVFNTLGLLHPRMRTALLSRELLNKKSRRIPVAIGRALAPERITSQPDDTALAAMLRLSTYAVGQAQPRVRRQERSHSPLASPIDVRLMQAEIECLKEHQLLASTADIQVVFARAGQIPWTLRELGRAREVAFRGVGEGTGRPLDLDRFDQHYVHLIAWHEADRQIAGAYRVGHTDQIVAQLGREGLYTHSLFSYGEPFLQALGAALELGRSFVNPQYQRNLGSLLALWKGIAAYVSRHPQYHVLFGPVSVSSDYRPHSRTLLIDVMRRHFYDNELARLIRPRSPFRRRHSLATLGNDLALLKDLEHLAPLVEEMEADGKSIPILLRQYLKLGARLVGFNVDGEFGDVVDGMIVVDLLRTDPRVLQKYMGREAAAGFMAEQRSPADVRTRKEAGQ